VIYIKHYTKFAAVMALVSGQQLGNKNSWVLTR